MEENGPGVTAFCGGECPVCGKPLSRQKELRAGDAALPVLVMPTESVWLAHVATHEAAELARALLYAEARKTSAGSGSEQLCALVEEAVVRHGLDVGSSVGLGSGS